MKRPQQMSIKTIRQQYQAVQSLGQGNYGCVYLYKRRDSDQQFALKITKTLSQHKRDEAISQIEIMFSLQHPHIVKIFKYYQETYPAYCNKKFEVGALMERGRSSLDNLLKDDSYCYSLADIRSFIVKFIQLGAYLEKNEIVHRDIKPANIIIFGEGLHFKLGDFGLSCSPFKRPKGFAGTPAYCSPGLKLFLNNGDHRKHPMTLAVKDDVYSLGLTFQQVAMARYSKQSLPEDIIDIISDMIRHQERDRPTFIGLMNHKSFLRFKKIEENMRLQYQLKQKEVQFSPQNLKKEDYTKLKQGEHNLSIQSNFRQKSKKIKQQYSLKIACKQIRTVCLLGNKFILCGNDRGQIISIDKYTGQQIKLSIGHEGYVAKIMVDKNDQVWSAGADGCVFMIKGEQLMRNIQNNKKIEVVKRFTLNGQSSDYQIITARIDEEIVFRVIQNPRQKYISQLYVQDQSHFAIGYCNGSVAVKWGDDPIKLYTINLQPITCIAVQNGILYSGDYSGVVKCYSLEKKIVEKTDYRLEKELISIKVITGEDGLNIEGVSCNGQIKIINVYKQSRTTFNTEICSKSAISTAYYQNSFFLLTSGGQIFFKNGRFTKFDREGPVYKWISIIKTNENQLIVVSREGCIWLITLEN